MSTFEQIVNSISGEFTKFFTYSSIQAKIMATILAIVLIIILRRSVINLFVVRLENPKVRYNWKRLLAIQHLFSQLLLLDKFGLMVLDL